MLLWKSPHTHRYAVVRLCQESRSPNTVGHRFEEMTFVTEIVAYFGMAYVDDCFHRIRIRESLGRFFVPGDFSARELGLTGSIFAGHPLVADARIRSCCASLPMCSGRGLYFGQMISEQQMSEANSLNTNTHS